MVEFHLKGLATNMALLSIFLNRNDLGLKHVIRPHTMINPPTMILPPYTPLLQLIPLEAAVAEPGLLLWQGVTGTRAGPATGIMGVAGKRGLRTEYILL